MAHATPSRRASRKSIFSRVKKRWVAVAAIIATVAGVITGAETILGAAARVLKPLLQAQTTIEIGLDASKDRVLSIGIAEGERVIHTSLLAGGDKISFRVPADAKYKVIWQGLGYKAGSADDVLAPRQTVHWRLVAKGQDEDGQTLAFYTEKAEFRVQDTPVAAELLVARHSLLPEVDRALSVVGLFETGATDCGTDVYPSPIGQAWVGCSGFTFPGLVGEIILELDKDGGTLLNKIFKQDTDLVRALAKRHAMDLEPFHALDKDTRIRIMEDGLRALAPTPEFRMQYQLLVCRYYRAAIQVAQSLGLQSERGVLFVFDRAINAGIHSVARFASDPDLKKIAEGDDRDRIKLLIDLNIQSLMGFHQDDASLRAYRNRMETFVTGKAVVRGITLDLNALGIRDDVPLSGMAER